MKRSPPTCRRASAQGWLLSGASRHSPAGRVALGSDEPQQRAADVDDWSIPDEAVVSLAAVTLLLQAEARGSGRRCSRLLLTSEGNWSRRADWRRGDDPRACSCRFPGGFARRRRVALLATSRELVCCRETLHCRQRGHQVKSGGGVIASE
jgi:hypothetical protein